MKKFLITLFFLATIAAVVFVIGWTELFVPVGSYGVLLSKTSGVNPQPIENARFSWAWERLIPTNSRILTFTLSPLKKDVTTAGSLPSGSLYSKLLEGNPDFSWKIGISLTARLQADRLPTLVKELHIEDQSALDNWMEQQINSLCAQAAEDLIHKTVNAESGNHRDLAKLIRDAIQEATPDFEIMQVSLSSVTLPDVTLYLDAAKTWEAFQTNRRVLLAETAKQESGRSLTEYMELERLAKVGELLTKYPILIEYLAISGKDSAQAIETLKALRK